MPLYNLRGIFYFMDVAAAEAAALWGVAAVSAT